MKFLPNALSFARLALGPYIFYLIWYRQYPAAFFLFLAAGMTDALDGLFARLLKVQSRFGEVLDPIADKVLIACVLVSLSLTHKVEPWLTALVLGRDLMILTAAGLALANEQQPKRFPPSIWGKLSTIAQIAFVVAVLGSLAAMLPDYLIEPLKWATLFLTIWSGYDYARRAASQ